jgi:hypothetical protein
MATAINEFINQDATEKDFLVAILSNRVEKVRQMVVDGARISPRSDSITSPLRAACDLPDANVLCFLLAMDRAGVNETHPNIHAKASTLAMYIVMHGLPCHLQAVLSNAEVNLTKRNLYDNTVLDLAWMHNKRMYRMLCVHLRAMDFMCRQPIHEGTSALQNK